MEEGRELALKGKNKETPEREANGEETPGEITPEEFRL